MASYPARESHFSHRFCRVLTKAAVAQEIGPEGCWMLSVIAHQEDAKRYRGAVTFYNGQLMPLCGFASEGRLVRARDRLVQAGWLHYESGGKSKPGTYWCLIPQEYETITDSAIDEGSPSNMDLHNGSESVAQAVGKCEGKRCSSGGDIEGQTKGKRRVNGGLPTLSLNPIPKNPPLPPEGEGEKPKAEPEPKPEFVTVDQLVFGPSLDNPESRQAFGEWLDYKRQRRQGYKNPNFAQKLLDEFSRDGPEVLRAAVNHSIGRNYQGLVRADAKNGPTPEQQQLSELSKAIQRAEERERNTPGAGPPMRGLPGRPEG